MNCREFTEFLRDYLSDALPDEARRAFEEHLDECPDCVEYLDNYRETIRLSRAAHAAPPANPPRELVDAILAALALPSGGKRSTAL